MRFLVSLLVLGAIAFSSVSASAISFGDNSVFLPNGVKYRIVFDFKGHIENTTSGVVLYDQNIGFRVNLTIVSKRLSLDYIGWGFVIELPQNSAINLGGNNLTKIPIPPILAVKENTREIYLPELLFKFLSGANITPDLQSLALEVYQLKINNDFYILNPFIIQSNLGIGSKVDYGFVNKTANKDFTVQGSVANEFSRDIFGVKVTLLNVSITYDSLTQLGNSLFGFFGSQQVYGEEVESILNSTSLSIGLAYDKLSGWLVSTGLKVHFDNSTLPSNITGYVDGALNVEMINPGNLKIGGYGYFSRYLGIPDVVLLGVDGFVIIASLFLVARRLKK